MSINQGLDGESLCMKYMGQLMKPLQDFDEKSLCELYWGFMDHPLPASICEDPMFERLDLKSIYQTLEHVWRELTCPKERTSVSTAYCRLVSAIKGGLTINVLHYRRDFNENRYMSTPTFRDELVQRLSSCLVIRYEELVEPAQRALPLIKKFVSPQQWEILSTKFGIPPVDRPYRIEDVRHLLSIKTREKARQLEAKALRDLRNSDLAKELWEPFF